MDQFVTFCAAGMPIILLVFTQRYAPNLGQSDSLCCAPPTGGGFKVDGVGGVLGDGFTERFYTQTYCWENMTDYPVRDEPSYDEGNLPMQVFDEQKSDQIKPLILVKVKMRFFIFSRAMFSENGAREHLNSLFLIHLGAVIFRIRF